jgi:hypothetical protein
MNRIDWNLIVLAAADGKALSPAQLQKVLFLLQDKHPGASADHYDFEPYDYGPFDAAVYADADQLEVSGLATISRATGGWKTYAATEAGLREASQLMKTADRSAVEYAKLAVEWARALSFRDLIQSIYQAYPNMKANSRFRE